MPKISVIVPVYKVEPYLCRCIDSVLAQTFTDFELILVDDGSPDNCGVICDEYAKKDNRIHVIHQQNCGLSGARNSGLDVATGEYIYFTDSDDWLNIRLFETIVPLMENGNDLVAFGYYYCPSSGIFKATHFSKIGVYQFDDDFAKAEFIAKVLVTWGIGWSAWSRIFCRNIIERFHIRFVDNQRIYAEDLYFSLCYFCHLKRIECIDEPMYYYSFREDSIVGEQRSILNTGRLNELSKAALQYYKEKSLTQPFFTIFPLMHYHIINHDILNFQQAKGYTTQQMRKMVIDNVEDLGFFTEQMKKVVLCKKWIRQNYSHAEATRLINTAKYYADGNILNLFYVNAVKCWSLWTKKICRVKAVVLRNRFLRF